MKDVLCFDVECDSLSGQVFAIGGVVLEAGTGRTLSEFFFRLKGGLHNPSKWVMDNVTPAVSRRAYTGNAGDVPEGDYLTLIKKFWGWWMDWKAADVTAVVDCGCPAEGGFLRDVLAEMKRADPSNEFAGPYPLHDVATALEVRGHGDPKRVEFLKASGVTLPAEYAEHDPVWDSWASARCWLAATTKA